MVHSLVPLKHKPLGLTLEVTSELIGILPGSSQAKLMQGVPLGIAIAQKIYEQRPQTQFILPVAPTLDLYTLAQYADPSKNLIIGKVGGIGAQLVLPAEGDQLPYLETQTRLKIFLWTKFPAYDVFSQCHLCLTTMGANTAELAALAIPMIVLLPTDQLVDVMRNCNGLSGQFANCPLVGGTIAKLIHWLALKQKRFFAWPNIWAKEHIVPELVGNLDAQAVAKIALDWLEYPDQRLWVRSRLRAVRGEVKASQKIASVLLQQLQNSGRLNIGK